MTYEPSDPDRMTVYRTSGAPPDWRRRQRRRQLRRRRLVALGAAVALVVAFGVGAWQVLGGSGGAGDGETGGGTTAGGRSPTPAGLAATSPSPAPPKVIEIGWVGDTTPGSQYGMPPDGGRALFADMRAKLRAPDLMIANLEGTYSVGGTSKCAGVSSGNCFAFQAPPTYAKALAWSGIDFVSVANNHSNDYFQAGLDQTTRALRKAGIEYTGLPGQVTVVDVHGVRVALVAFSPYPWNANMNDIPGARKLVRRAAAKADIVVVLMHAGAEGADKMHTPRGPEVAFGELRGDIRTFSHAVVDAGADLVLGSGPHVIRGIERYKGRLIAYSLGNFAGWGNFGLSGNLGISGLLTVRIDQTGRIRGGRWLSLYLAEPGVPRPDPAQTAAGLVRQLSAADFARTYKLDARGSFSGK
jgi:Bacterial capsule synthesis protein PGA_cap